MVWDSHHCCSKNDLCAQSNMWLVYRDSFSAAALSEQCDHAPCGYMVNSGNTIKKQEFLGETGQFFSLCKEKGKIANCLPKIHWTEQGLVRKVAVEKESKAFKVKAKQHKAHFQTTVFYKSLIASIVACCVRLKELVIIWSLGIMFLPQMLVGSCHFLRKVVRHFLGMTQVMIFNPVNVIVYCKAVSEGSVLC